MKNHADSNPHLFRKTYAEIHLSALRANCRALQQLNPPKTFFCPMVKSNAYGHGDLQVAQALVDEGVTSLGLAFTEEGISLRGGGLQEAQLLIFGLFDKEGAAALIEHRLTPVLSNYAQIQHLLNVLPKGSHYPVHLKFNSGMYRLGFPLEEASALSEFLEPQDQLHIEGICTHLAEGEDSFLSEGVTEKQLTKMNPLRHIFRDTSIQWHALNSSGMIGQALRARSFDGKGQWNLPTQSLWGSRPGLAIYGIKPVLEGLDAETQRHWQEIELTPVMKLRSEIVQCNETPPGHKVSYGGQWTSDRQSRVGVIPIGYGDGYSRLLSNKAQVLFRGQRVPVVGTICMDYTMIDLTDVLGEANGAATGKSRIDRSSEYYGEEVVLFGVDELLVDEVAEWAQTISYELLTSIGRRVERVYL